MKKYTYEEYTEKECTKCKKVKPLREFNRDARYKDGRMLYCKECRKPILRAWQQKPEVKKRHIKNGGAWEKRNREKKRGHRSLKRALAEGKITKFPCLVCGDENSQAHHYNYKDRLNVIWVCAKHHAEIHSEGITLKELHDNFADCHASPEDGCEVCDNWQELQDKRSKTLKVLNAHERQFRVIENALSKAK